MAVVSAGDLRNRVEVLRRTGRINPRGEQTYDYEAERRVWAKIVPTAGRGENVEGDMERAEVTHRITVRRASIPNLTTDLRLRFREQVYEVQYFYPNYRDSGFLDLYARLVIEDGTRSF